MATPHIGAAEGGFAPTVLMPGDPLRARYIAEVYLAQPSCVNEVRNMLAYTGTWQGQEVSVMGSGMGMPSIGIYSWELFQHYGVQRIIRVGSCGAYSPELKLFDLLLADAAYSESSYAKVQAGVAETHLYPSPELTRQLAHAAEQLGIAIRRGTIHSSDVFYREHPETYQDIYQEHGALAVEMESFALFHNARQLGRQAACLLTVSDLLPTGEQASSREREQAFTQMMEVALNTATSPAT